VSKIVNIGEQQVHHFLYDASGTITTGGTPQLVLPQQLSRSFLVFTNNSAADTLYIDFGCGSGPLYAVASLTNGKVTSISVVNAGFNFTKPPLVRLLGGGVPQGFSGLAQGPNTSYVGGAGPNFPAPTNVATAVATLASSSISLNQINTIVVTNGGSGYIVAPYVQLIASDLDPNGVAIPGSTYASSIPVFPGGSISFLAGMCPTDAMSVGGATTADAFTCKFMT